MMIIRNRPVSVTIVAGILLFLLGVLLWQATAIDQTLHVALRLPATSRWVAPVLGLTNLGEFDVLGLLSLAVILLLAVRRRRRDALWLFVTLASGRLAIELIKTIVERPRPPVADRLEVVKSWSFTSSHSAGTMLTALAFAMLAGGGAAAMTMAIAVAVLIGWTRLALGVHWTSDVVAGWGFGLLWAGMAWRWLPSTKSRSH
jgi:undecaprenyl-diphosphatase